MQSIQNLMIKASICQAMLMDKHAEKFDSENIELLSNSLVLLGQSNRLINMRRKETHRADLDPKYHNLCSASVPFTDFLYGNDVDVNKNVREINDLLTDSVEISLRTTPTSRMVEAEDVHSEGRLEEDVLLVEGLDLTTLLLETQKNRSRGTRNSR